MSGAEGSAMSRPFARLKLGYYPLPIEEARNIRSALLASGPYCAIDPCAGDGAALLEITKDTGAQPAANRIGGPTVSDWPGILEEVAKTTLSVRPCSLER